MVGRLLGPVGRWGSHPELSVPAFVLRYGGFGNQTAVTCAALCRACGLPAQLTYSPTHMLTAFVDVFLPGGGWYRLQPGAAAALSDQAATTPRVLNLPIEAERDREAYLGPYSSQGDRNWTVVSDGRPNCQIRSWNAVEDGGLVEVAEPFAHYECSTVSRSLGSEPFAGAWLAWDELAKLSLEATSGLGLGGFAPLTARVPAAAVFVEKGLAYRPPAAAEQGAAAGPPPASRPARR